MGVEGERPCGKESLILAQPLQVRSGAHYTPRGLVNQPWFPFPRRMFTEHPFQVSECF